MIRIRLNALLTVSFAIHVMACKKDSDAPVVDNETYEVAPNFTNNAYGSNENAHLIMRSSSAAGDRLFLFIGGTWSKPKNYEVICDYIRNAGYHVISLSYPNNIPAAHLGSSENPEVYSQYRQEICFGTPVSVDVDVASYSNQVKNLRAMDILGDSDTTIRIETQESPSFGGYRAYHTGIDVISTHGSVASSKWHMSSFWDYLFDI